MHMHVAGTEPTRRAMGAAAVTQAGGKGGAQQQAQGPRGSRMRVEQEGDREMTPWTWAWAKK